MSSQSWWFAFRGNELLVRIGDSEARLPSGAEWKDLGMAVSAPHEIGTFQGMTGYAVGLPQDVEPPEGMVFQGLRKLWGLLDEEAWRLAGRAVQIVEWDRNHRFCGRCGSETKPHPKERSRVCPNCGLEHYPRLSPAVIVLIEKGDRMLLARSPHFARGVYSTLAGFVEPGESLEQTVAREVFEEVGVELANIRYFGSQPWPFPNSLMLGFTAEYAGGELRPQEGEIEDARWFGVDNLPLLPPRMSIARALIDDFLARHGHAGAGETVRWT